MPERPDFSEYQSSDNSHFRFLGNLFDSMEDSGLENLPDMPKRDVYKGIDVNLEPRILKQYRQSYITTALGLNRTSLVMQAILLEMLVKEYYVAHTGEVPDRWDFGDALSMADDENLLPEEKMKFLRDFKNEIRNPWFHDDIEDIAGDRKMGARAISLDTDGDIGEQIQEAKNKPMNQEMSVEDNRVIGDILMSKREEEIYLEKFQETDDFVRWIFPKITQAHE
jgi:hypothetical protein